MQGSLSTPLRRIRHMKGIVSSVFPWIICMLLSAWNVSSAQPASGATRARFINLYPFTPGLDVFIDNGNESVAIGQDITCPGASAITDISSGENIFRLYKPGDEMPSIEFSVTIEEGFTYSFFMLQYAPNYYYLHYVAHPTDEEILPGETAVRFLHASYRTGPIDIKLTTSDGEVPGLSELPFNTPTGHGLLASGPAEVAVASASNGSSIFSAGFDLSSQEAITLILAGGGAAGPLQLYMLVDTDTAAQVPLQPLSRSSSSVAEEWDGESVGGSLLVHPNPSADMVNISFDLPVAGIVHCALYNQQGELVATPLNSWEGMGVHSIPISVQEVPAGVYTVVLRYSGKVLIERLVITR